jgi:hypothetical protein
LARREVRAASRLVAHSARRATAPTSATLPDASARFAPRLACRRLAALAELRDVEVAPRHPGLAHQWPRCQPPLGRRSRRRVDRLLDGRGRARVRLGDALLGHGLVVVALERVVDEPIGCHPRLLVRQSLRRGQRRRHICAPGALQLSRLAALSLALDPRVAPLAHRLPAL